MSELMITNVRQEFYGESQRIADINRNQDLAITTENIDAIIDIILDCAKVRYDHRNGSFLWTIQHEENGADYLCCTKISYTTTVFGDQPRYEIEITEYGERNFDCGPDNQVVIVPYAKMHLRYYHGEIYHFTSPRDTVNQLVSDISGDVREFVNSVKWLINDRGIKLFGLSHGVDLVNRIKKIEDNNDEKVIL